MCVQYFQKFHLVYHQVKYKLNDDLLTRISLEISYFKCFFFKSLRRQVYVQHSDRVTSRHIVYCTVLASLVANVPMERLVRFRPPATSPGPLNSVELSPKYKCLFERPLLPWGGWPSLVAAVMLKDNRC